MSNWFPPPSRPRPVDNGLKARSTRGVIGRTWWSRRFIEVLEAMGMGSRLQRGRSYARKGQVMSLQVSPGLITAEVQGSRARPYRVRIGIGAFGKNEWAQVETALAGDAWYAAALLAGQMPEDIEDVFSDLGLSLFPAAARELSLDCSCPDIAVPCKHLAAAFYLLAESFDDDPFGILAWRGRERADLLANVQAARSDGRPASDRAEPSGRPLDDCIDSFYVRQAAFPVHGPRAVPAAALLDQMPPVTVAVRGRPLAEVLRPAYEALASPLNAGVQTRGTGSADPSR